MPDAVEGGEVLRQFLAMTRLSFARYVRSRHLATVLVFTFFPLAVACLVVLGQLFWSEFSFSSPLVPARPGMKMDADLMTVEGSAQIFYMLAFKGMLYLSVMFSAIQFGSACVREEFDDQTFHYLVLQPVQRCVLLAGKCAGFLLMSLPVILGGMVLCQLILLIPFGLSSATSYLFSVKRIVELIQCGGALAIGMVMYSAVFLAFSTFFKNMAFSLFLYGWEAAIPYLPSTVKNFTVGYYLSQFLPASRAAEANLIGVLAEGPGVIQTVLVLGGTLACSLAIAGFALSRRECVYSNAN